MELEKEIIKEVLRRAENENLQDIKDSWDMRGFIGRKKDELAEEIKSYKQEILTYQDELKDLRKELADGKHTIEDLESKKQRLEEDIKQLTQELKVEQAKSEVKAEQKEVLNSRQKLLPAALKSVQIYLKDGSVAKAKPAQKLFGEDIYKKYRVELKENHILKMQLTELELENKRLSIELRDFYAELVLEGMSANEPKEATKKAKIETLFDDNKESNNKANNQTGLKEKKSSEIIDSKGDFIATQEDISEFKQMLKAQKEKRARIDKKK